MKLSKLLHGTGRIFICFPLLCALYAFGMNAPLVHADTDGVETERHEPDREDNGGADPAEDGERIMEIEELEEKRFTLNLKNAPLEDFFALTAAETGLSFIVEPNIEDITVTTFMPAVRLSRALDALLEVYNLETVEIEENILLIRQKEPFDPVVDLEINLVKLKYLDAEDMKATLEPFMSQHGKISIVESSGYTSWGGGQGGVGTGSRGTGERRRKVESNMLIIRERPELINSIMQIVETMDVRADQVLISAHILEVQHDKIRDIGVDWNSSRGDLLGDIDLGAWGAPPEAVARPGMGLHFNRVDGRDQGELEAFFRMLEEEADGDILSAPRLLTSDRQECSIMVGQRFPILLTDVDPETGQRTSSLDYYEDVGVQLNVLPRIKDDKVINMIIRPVISAEIDNVEATGEGGVVLARYPIIGTREAETQVSIQSGQTIVIGGLIKEESSQTIRGIPLLKDLPLLGNLFRRQTDEKEKLDLLIFLSADIIKSPEYTTPEQVRDMGKGVVRTYENEITLRAYPLEGGSAVDLTDEAPYNIDEEALLKATPETGYEFKKWTGHTELITEGAPDDAEITVTVADEDAWFTANFELIDYSLSLEARAQNTGQAVDLTDAAPYNIGNKARLRAEPEIGYEFAQWTGDTGRLEDPEAADTLLTFHDHHVSLTANFKPIDYAVHLQAQPERGGTAKDLTDAYPYHIGDSVRIKAEPAEGYEFVKWNGDIGQTEDAANAETTVTIPAGDVNLEAVFEPIEYALIMESQPLGTTETKQPLYVGNEVEVMAVPSVGYSFHHWNGDTELIIRGEETKPNITIRMPAHDVFLAANFEPIEYTLHLQVEPDAGGKAIDITDDAPYRFGDEINIRAEAAAGYEFIGWSGDVAYINDPNAEETTLVIEKASPRRHRSILHRIFPLLDRPEAKPPGANISLTANFQPIDYGLDR